MALLGVHCFSVADCLQGSQVDLQGTLLHHLVVVAVQHLVGNLSVGVLSCYLFREVPLEGGPKLLVVVCLVEVAFESQPVVVFLECGHKVAATVQIVHLSPHSSLVGSLPKAKRLEVLRYFLYPFFLTQVWHQVLFWLREQTSISTNTKPCYWFIGLKTQLVSKISGWLDVVLIVWLIQHARTLLKRFVQTFALLLQCGLRNDVIRQVVLVISGDMRGFPVAGAKQVNSVYGFVDPRLLLQKVRCMIIPLPRRLGSVDAVGSFQTLEREVRLATVQRGLEAALASALFALRQHQR